MSEDIDTSEEGVQVPTPKLGRPRKYGYPSKLVCTVTGKEVLTNPTQFRKQLEASGMSQEDYINSYVCRTARSKIKSGTLVVAEDGSVSKAEPPVKNTQRGRPRTGGWDSPEVVETILDRAFPADAPLVEWGETPDNEEEDDNNENI